MSSRRVRYRIDFEGGGRVDLEIVLDGDTLELLAPLPDTAPSWAALAFHRCPHCPLDPEESPDCPAAVALAPLVDAFDRYVSYHPCSVVIETRERAVTRSGVAAQKVLGSLMGLVMPGSGCPHTARLRPMARFHLPLASPEETVYRASSMYLLAQFLRGRAGLDADRTLEGLTSLYGDLSVVNRHLSRRLRAVVETDSSVNAVVGLDVFTAFLPMAVEESLAELRPWFGAWLEPREGEPG